MLPISGSDIVSSLNLAISGVAALAALLLLWFTALKGPDIVLVSSKSKLEYVDKSNTDLSLTRVSFKPVDLVFANNGSRSGALIEVVALFKPSRAFESFFWKDYASSQLSSDRSTGELPQSLELPVVIPERGTLVVSLTMGLLLRPWKNVERLVLTQEDMRTANETVWKEGRSALNRFAGLDEPIGVLEISIRKTIRRRLRTAIGETVASTVNVGGIPIWIKEQARSYLDKFSEVYPRDEDVALQIRRVLDQFFEDVSRNSKLLESAANQGQANQLSTAGWDRWFGPYSNSNDLTYRPVITKNTTLTSKVTSYYQAVMKYNKRVVAAAPGEGPVIDALAINVKKTSAELEAELAPCHKGLIRATEFLFPVP